MPRPRVPSQAISVNPQSVLQREEEPPLSDTRLNMPIGTGLRDDQDKHVTDHEFADGALHQNVGDESEQRGSGKVGRLHGWLMKPRMRKKTYARAKMATHRNNYHESGRHNISHGRQAQRIEILPCTCDFMQGKP